MMLERNERGLMLTAQGCLDMYDPCVVLVPTPAENFRSHFFLFATRKTLPKGQSGTDSEEKDSCAV